MLKIKSKDECKWDIVSLGEVMLRLDPGDKRIHTTRSFEVWEGGGEYNVARGLKRCFGLDAAVVTALADNPIGRLVQDLIYQGGIANMRYSISTTAKYGDITRGPRVVTDQTKQEMKKILGEIQSGQFAKEWVLENQANRPVYNALLKKGEGHPIEEVGARLRSMMPWLKKDQLVDKNKN